MAIIREEIQQFIEGQLGWQVVIAKNRNEAVKICETQQAEFYILDIKLGNERSRSQEGMDTAEQIRSIDENVFVSIFSGVPNLEPHKKMAKRIGVNYFEEKGNIVREGVSRIAVEMLRFQKNLLDSIFQKYLHSSAYLGEDEILKIVNKIKEVNKKLEDIQRLEKSYQSNSTDHPLDEANNDEKRLNPAFLPIEDDDNILKYESLKQNSEWREKYQNKYVAFADGKWLSEFVADNSHDLLNCLRNSDHKGKAIFYPFVGEELIIELPLSLLEILDIE
jgi:DNA-binding response OmpR family regulator